MDVRKSFTFLRLYRVDASGDSGQVIDAEYTVISSSEDHAEK